MEVKKILWPTDVSDNAARAMPMVTSLSEKYQAEVHVLYVIEAPGHFGAWYGEFDLSQVEKLREMERTQAEERLAEICENNLLGCPLYVRHIAVGDPAGEILKLIEKENMDIVVLSSHGRKGTFHFGGVAEKVVKHSPIPVLTVPVTESR